MKLANTVTSEKITYYTFYLKQNIKCRLLPNIRAYYNLDNFINSKKNSEIREIKE